VATGEVPRTLAGGDHSEAGGASPVDQLGGQRRLVAIGHRVDDAGRASLGGEQRSGEDIGLDVDHDDVLAGGDGGAGVEDAGLRAAGGVDHHVDVGASGQFLAVSEQCGALGPLCIPADRGHRRLGALGREVGDGGHLQPRRGRDLAEEHRAELAGTDQPGADRAALRRLGLELGEEVHGDPS